MSKIEQTKNNNNKVYAVGTTATRALENYATRLCRGDFFGEADFWI